MVIVFAVDVLLDVIFIFVGRDLSDATNYVTFSRIFPGFVSISDSFSTRPLALIASSKADNQGQAAVCQRASCCQLETYNQ